MCGQRNRMIGPVVIAPQSSGTNLPSTTAWPRGTCIQLLFARIQKDDSMVANLIGHIDQLLGRRVMGARPIMR
jgi:hypothetical protein